MWIPEPETDGLRRYRKWAGNPKGNKENTGFCIAVVHDTGHSPLSHQCNKKRGHGPDGLYCKQHASKLSKDPGHGENSRGIACRAE